MSVVVIVVVVRPLSWDADVFVQGRNVDKVWQVATVLAQRDMHVSNGFHPAATTTATTTTTTTTTTAAAAHTTTLANAAAARLNVNGMTSFNIF